MAPAIPFATWLLVTFSYRQDKLMIIRQVGKHVSEADLGRGAADDAVSSQQSSSRSASSRGSLQGGFEQPAILSCPACLPVSLPSCCTVCSHSQPQTVYRHTVCRHSQPQTVCTDMLLPVSMQSLSVICAYVAPDLQSHAARRSVVMRSA